MSKKDKRKAALNKNKQAAKQKRHPNHTDNSVFSQRLRILEWFKTRQSLTTHQAREILDVMHPAARIMELRKQEYDILTYRTKEVNAQGQLHCIAKYVLMKRKVGA